LTYRERQTKISLEASSGDIFADLGLANPEGSPFMNESGLCTGYRT
jgi:hypothetical protein